MEYANEKKIAEKSGFMQKKAPVCFVFLPIVLILIFSGGCAASGDQTPASLLRALGKTDPAYAFPAESLFYKDGTYFAFYSLHEENDLLLTLRTDERRRVRRAAVTAQKGSEAAGRDLAPLGLELSRLLLGETCETDLLSVATGLALLPQTPADALNTYELHGDRAALFCGEHALCFFVELRDYGENTSEEGLFDSTEAQLLSSDAVSGSGDNDIVSMDSASVSAEAENSSPETEIFSSESDNFSSETP